MNNPFDRENEKNEAIIFTRVTEAINYWLLQKFPEYDVKLIEKINRVEIEHRRILAIINDYEDSQAEYTKSITEKIIKDVNDFLMKEYPDLDKSLKMTAKNAENRLKKLEKKIKEMEQIHKHLKISDSICEDVYKMRDEFKQIKKFLEEFKTQVKRAFMIKEKA